MRHLKTFENYSPLNEELVNKTRKFFTGFSDKNEKETKKKRFEESLKEIEEKVYKNPKKFNFPKEKIEQKAKKDKYKGTLKIRKGRRKDILYVIYEEGITGLQKLAHGASTV